MTKKSGKKIHKHFLNFFGYGIAQMFPEITIIFAIIMLLKELFPFAIPFLWLHKTDNFIKHPMSRHLIMLLAFHRKYFDATAAVYTIHAFL